MPEHVQNNIDLVHAERRFPAFQFPDEADAHPGAVRQAALRQFVAFPLLADKVFYFQFYTLSVLNLMSCRQITPFRV